MGKIQIGRDMCFCPKAFEIPIAVEQNPYEYFLLSVLVYIVPDRFAPEVIEQERALGIVSDDIVLVLCGIIFINYFLGTNGGKPQFLEPVLLGHVLDDPKARGLSGPVRTENEQSLSERDIFQYLEFGIPVPVPAKMPEEIFVAAVHFEIEIATRVIFLCRPEKNFFKKRRGT
ncbi:hypothetical protein [Pseudozobellia sp. WGM2]|uniref:hypothetical protein n=1 Tax=Pseudozobellia sp. WGM2 TaxID=2787625 RepID=UPI001AE046AB|nr:hypothetical protein [Pseudozobellia sp. WGM2]